MKNYFADAKTLEDVKKIYRDLCRTYHPDLNPTDVERCTKIMQEINAQYAVASENARRAEARKKASETGKPEPTAADYVEFAKVDEAIRAAIEKIITFSFLEIEICGLWVWVGGTQKRGTSAENDAALDTMQAAGYHFAHKKAKWYFEGCPSRGRGNFSMDDIRARYGSVKVEAKRPADDTKKTKPQPQYFAK